LKRFHWLCGPTQASLMIADHPAEMRRLAQIQAEKALEALEEVVDVDGVFVFEWPENLDSLFYSPPLFREFCLPVMQLAAGMIHARNKYMFAHACGRLKALGPLFLEAGLDCVEGHAHPPLGDWRLEDARALSDRLIVCGGMTAVEQEWTGPDTADRIDRYVRDLLASMGDKRRFLFSSGCNISPRTPYENLIAFRDAVWKYGGVHPGFTVAEQA
jgi:uroporphyrinogen-III decarboxylase